MKKLLILLIIIILGLEVYFYLQSGGDTTTDTSKKAETESGVDDATSWSFAVAGDSERGEEIFERIIGEVNASEAEQFIHLGDITYRGTTAQLATAKEQLEKFTVPYFVAVGNHEILDTKDRTDFADIFNKPYTSFTHRNATFIVLDNADRKEGFADAELDRLETTLKNRDCDKRYARCFTFLFFHRPVPSPLFALFTDDETSASRSSNERFLSIIETYPVDHIFSSNVHVYFSYDLYGTPVTISGGAGSPPQDFIADLFGTDAFFHYLLVTVDDAGYEVTIQRI